MQWTASSSSSEKVNRRLIIAVMALVYRKYTVAGLLIGNDESFSLAHARRVWSVRRSSDGEFKLETTVSEERLPVVEPIG